MTAAVGLGRMQHDEDPAEAIFKQVGMKNGKIPGFTLLKNDVLCGIYKRPEKTQGGILLTQTTRQEDEYQGKAALVLMKGEAAFQSDKNFDFLGDNLEVGDWVMLFVSHGLKCYVNGQLCRIIRDQDLTMKIPSPDQVY